MLSINGIPEVPRITTPYGHSGCWRICLYGKGDARSALTIAFGAASPSVGMSGEKFTRK